MEAAFRSYVEQCPDAVLVTDPHGRIVYVNPAFERMTGYACSELAGRTPAVLKSGMHEADFYRRLWSALGVDASPAEVVVVPVLVKARVVNLIYAHALGGGALEDGHVDGLGVLARRAAEAYARIIQRAKATARG